MINYPDSEQALEDATVDLFRDLGYEAINAYDETFGSDGTLGRKSSLEVMFGCIYCRVSWL